MNDKRRGLGRGLGALIPSAGGGGARPVDMFFGGGRVAEVERAVEPTPSAVAHSSGADPGEVSRETSNSGVLTETRSAVGSDPDGEGGAEPVPAVEGLSAVPGVTYADVAIDLVRPNPRQPRRVFDDDDMAELAHSIREIGVLQPIVVRPVPAVAHTDRDPMAEPNETGVLDSAGAGASGSSEGSALDGVRYEIVMGERRWRASQLAGLATVPAIIKETQDDDLLRDALLENLHRSQLNALEEAAAYQQLLDDFNCTHDELAARIGRSRPQISNTLRLLKLPPLVARRVAAGVLSAGHARALLGLPDGAAMERMAQRIVAEGLSVRNVEELVAVGAEQARPVRTPRPGARHPALDDVAAALSDRLDTRVTIALGRRKGKLMVEFASVDDLNRILDLTGLRAATRDSDSDIAPRGGLDTAAGASGAEYAAGGGMNGLAGNGAGGGVNGGGAVDAASEGANAVHSDAASEGLIGVAGDAASEPLNGAVGDPARDPASSAMEGVESSQHRSITW